MLKLIVLTELLVCVFSTVDSIHVRRDWSKLNLNELEREWDIIDDDDILNNERQHIDAQEIKEKKMEQMQNLLENGVPPTDPKYKKLSSEVDQAKPAMIFAKLDIKRVFEKKGKKAPTKEVMSLEWHDLADICDEWHVSYSNGYPIQLSRSRSSCINILNLFTIVQHWIGMKMISIMCYPMEPDSILVTTKRGAEDGEDVWRYLEMQKEIEELSWNERKIQPKDLK